MSSYVICDEPQEHLLKSFVVHPLLPFFAALLLGPLYGWLWLLFNSYALSKKLTPKEIIFCVSGFIGIMALYYGLAWFIFWQKNIFYGSPYLISYTYLIVDFWKLFISFNLFIAQESKYHTYNEYYADIGTTKKQIIIGIIIITMLRGFAKHFISPFLSKIPFIALLVNYYV